MEFARSWPWAAYAAIVVRTRGGLRLEPNGFQQLERRLAAVGAVANAMDRQRFGDDRADL